MSRRKRVLFLAISLAGIWLAIEVTARLTLTGPPTGDKSLESEWDWARIRLAAGAATGQGDFLYDPLLGWRLKPDLRSSALTTNSEGIRDDREIPLDPAPGERRIALVGDSFTFGHGNADHETFGWFLQQSLGARATVLNFGVPSYGTDQAVLLFEERARRFHPQVVVLGVFLQDYQRNLLSFRDYAKPRFVPEDGPPPGLRLTNVPIVAPEALYEEYRSGRRQVGGGVRSWAWGAAARGLNKLSLARINEGAEGFVVLSGLLARFRESARQAGAEPVCLVLPNGEAVYDPASRWCELERLVLARAEKLGLRRFSMTPAFRVFAAGVKPDEERIFQTRTGSGHLTAAANRVVAREIERYLREAGLLRLP